MDPSGLDEGMYLSVMLLKKTVLFGTHECDNQLVTMEKIPVLFIDSITNVRNDVDHFQFLWKNH